MIITPQTYYNYFEAIATKLKLIEHSGSNKRFFALDVEELLTSFKADFTGYGLILENFDSSYFDHKADNIRQMPECAFSIVKIYDRRNSDNSDLVTLKTATYAAVEQVIAKIRKDYRDRVLSGLETDSFKTHWVGPIAGNCFGHRCTFSFNQPASGLTYDASKWNT